MLDIGIIIPELAKYGGAERLLVECISRWQRKHKLTVYSTEFAENLLSEHGVKKEVTLVKISPYFEGPHSIVLNCVLLPKIWENEIDVHDIYHAHLWPTHLVDLHPMVWYPHEPLRVLHDLRHNQSVKDFSRSIHIYPKYNYDKLEEKTYEAYLSAIDSFDKLGRPDRIVANSRYTARYLEEIYNRPVKDVVYPGVNTEDFIHAAPENMVMAIGQLWLSKRVKLIIEAIKYVEGMQLYIVGSGPERENLKAITAKLGLADRVFFLEGLSNQEVQILFSRCLAVIFTPIKEPFGIVALEAMAAGKPLIAVNEGGFTEVVDDSCAFLVPPQPAAIAEKIAYLKDHKQVAEEMGLQAIKKAKNYTWDRCAQELLQKLEQTHADWNKKRRIAASKPRRDRPLFGVQYYCWYGDGLGSRHWNDSSEHGGVTDMPALGYYASSLGVTIEAHLRILEDAGVDFLILNLHIDNNGVNSYELSTIKNIIAVAQKKASRLKFAIQFCIYDHLKEEIPKVLKQLRKIVLKGPNYLRYGGKPVMFLFWTGIYDGNKKFLNLLDENLRGFIKVASSLRLYSVKNEHKKTYGFFDGFSLFSPLELSSEENRQKIWQEAYKNSAAGKMDLKILTVSPGYDDTHLKDPERTTNPHRAIDRENGNTYKKMIAFGLSRSAVPDMVIISTFNEYHENTHIEPSFNFGDRYMRMTKEFIKQGRKKWKRSPKRC